MAKPPKSNLTVEAHKHDDATRQRVWVSGNWRVTFQFVGRDAELVDYEDYH